MAESALGQIPGGQELIEWFGYVPNFHDAELQELTFSSRGESTLRLRTWEMTDKLDDGGYYILEKHVGVLLTLEVVRRIDLEHFQLPGIISRLEITTVKHGFQFTWDGSYGVEGTVCADRARIQVIPEATPASA